MSRRPGPDEQLVGTAGRGSAFTSVRQHQREELRLKASIVQSVVVRRTSRFECGGHLGGLCFLPAAACSSHEVGLHVDCGEPKGVGSQVFVEVVVDE